MLQLFAVIQSLCLQRSQLQVHSEVADGSCNLIYVVVCFCCNGEYIGETGTNKQKLRDRVRVYRQHIRQPQYQQLKVEGHQMTSSK